MNNFNYNVTGEKRKELVRAIGLLTKQRKKDTGKTAYKKGRLDLASSHTLYHPITIRITVQGTAASRVFFRIVAKAVRMRRKWPDVILQGPTRPLKSPSASLSFAAFDLCR